MKRFIILILLSILIINSRTFAFLFGEEKNTKDSRAVAVTVNGAKIYEDTLLRIAKHRAEETAQSNPDFELTQARNVVIGEMVLTEVIIQEGRKKLVWVADKEVQDLISRWEGAPYDELKKNEGFKGDFYEYERGIKASAFIYPKLLLKEYSGKLEPTEEQMKTYYNQHINEYCHQEPEKYRLKNP